MKLAKWPKIINAKFYKNEDKLRRDLYYNDVISIRRTTLVCTRCKKRKWKEDIVIIQSLYKLHPEYICKNCL